MKQTIRFDIIVGAIQIDTGGGYARVFSGANGAELFRWLGDQAGDALGVSVAGAADVDGDGIPDVLAGDYLVRVRVDGAESPLEYVTPTGYNNPRVTLP